MVWENDSDIRLEPVEQAADAPAPDTPSAAGREQTEQLALLQAELEAERGKRCTAEEQALRYRADFENLRRRSMNEAEQIKLNLTQDLCLRLLPVLDDLDRALALLKGSENAAPQSWAEGLSMAQRRFLDVLGDFGLTRMQAAGESFDPNRHDAMLRVEDSGLPANTIVEELRPGYCLGDRVIRPALVKVQA